GHVGLWRLEVRMTKRSDAKRDERRRSAGVVLDRHDAAHATLGLIDEAQTGREALARGRILDLEHKSTIFWGEGGMPGLAPIETRWWLHLEANGALGRIQDP